MRVGGEDRGEPGHAQVPEQRHDVPLPRVGAALRRAAAVHQHGAPVGEPQQRGVALADREEEELQAAAEPRRLRAQRAGHGQAGGRRADGRQPPQAAQPEGEERQQDERGGERQRRPGEVERSPGWRRRPLREGAQRAGEGPREPDERQREGGPERRREGADRPERRQGRADWDGGHVRREPQERELPEVMGEEWSGRDRGRD